MSASQQVVQPTRSRLQKRCALTAIIVLACLASCSLQDFDKLGSGKSNAGGVAGKGGGGKNGEGGVGTPGGGVSGSTSAGGTESGGATDGSAGFAATATTAGSGAVAGAEGVGGNTTQAGAQGISGNANQAGAACGAGLSSCPSEPACTTNLATGTPSGATVNHCGSCDTTCSVVNATSAACNNGQCAPTCSTGFLDCNVTTKNDGCEVDGNVLTRCGTTCTNAVACPASQVCNAGACGAPQGMVVFSMPLTATGLKQRYADKFPTKPNLTDGTLTLRLYAPGATSGEVNIYAADSDFTGGNGTLVGLNALSTGWVDINVPIGGVLDLFDPSVITQVNIEIASTGAGPWLNPTLVYVDSVRSSNGAVNDTFDTAIGNMVGSSMLKIDGSTLSWISAVP